MQLMNERSDRPRWALALFLALALLVPVGPVHGGDTVCADAIWDATPADLPLDDGWRWEFHAPYVRGSLGGNVDVSAEDGDMLWFAVACSPDARAQFEAEAAMVDAIIPMFPLATVPLGDGVRAYRGIDARDDGMLIWYRDDVIARVSAPSEADWAAVLGFAAALDTMLP